MAFAHFTMATRDVSRTRDFFAAALRWQPIDRPSNIDMPAAWLSIAPGQELHLLEVPEFEPSPFEREFGRHFAITWPREDVAGLKDRLIQNGAELIDPLRATPAERFFFQEPNGYVFEVIVEE